MKIDYMDAYHMLVGEKISYGHSRKVYNCNLIENAVVKVAIGNSYANVTEFDFWRNNQDYEKVSNWLAPCYWLSPNSRLMIQAKCEPIPKRLLPKKVPGFLTDLKPENWGLFEDRPVCLDYSFTVTRPQTKLKKVDWYEK